MTLVDIRRLLTTLTSVANETRLGHDVTVEVRFEGRSPTDTFSVPGHDSRLGQVISNLLSNAQSFSEPGNKVRITAHFTDMKTGQMEVITECLVVFVAVDPAGQTIPVKAWRPETPADIALAQRVKAHLDAARAALPGA